MRLRSVLVIATSILSVAGATLLDASADPPISTKSMLEVELKTALKARVESAQAVFDAMLTAFKPSTVSLEDIVDASKELSEAQVAAAANSGEAIAALTAYVQRAKLLESNVEMQYKAGVAGVNAKEYFTAKRERQSAEIALLEARIKAEH